MTLATPQFLYFDLGNVLLHFDPVRLTRQISDRSQVDAQRIWKLLFETDLYEQYEHGRINSVEFHARFLDSTGATIDYDTFQTAACDVFQRIDASLRLVEKLRAAGHRLGILSNTNEGHWRFITERYPEAGQFDIFALSYQLGAMKPHRAIFDAAQDLAGVDAARVFFVDDRQENVDGALAAGFDAVMFVDTPQLERDLLARGVNWDNSAA
jgi:HAD superfamily hydrolase (TIGR01509 family)